jgi:hypothetical protein
MSRAAPAPVETPADRAAKHERLLLRALQTAHPVLYQGKQRFVKSLSVQLYGGGTQSSLYLSGLSDEVPAEQVQIQEGY